MVVVLVEPEVPPVDRAEAIDCSCVEVREVRDFITLTLLMAD